MGVEREKKLSTCKISQLETCPERGADNVRHVENRKNGKIHERFRSKSYKKLFAYNVFTAVILPRWNKCAHAIVKLTIVFFAVRSRTETRNIMFKKHFQKLKFNLIVLNC